MTQRKKQAPAGENDPQGQSEVAGMQAEIDQTRTEISDDLRTLGEKLNPERLKQEAKEVMQEAKGVAVDTLHEAKNVATSTFREVKDNAMDTVHEKVDDIRTSVRRAELQTRDFLSENAVPLALIGIGAAWFMAKRRSRSRAYYEGYGQAYSSAERPRGSDSWTTTGGGRDITERARQMKDRVGERVRGVAEGAEGRFDEVKGRVRDFAEREADQMRSLVQGAGQRVSESAEQARDFVGRELRQARDFSQRVSDENPLAIGMAAVGAGIAVGLLLPQTRPERELLGQRRDELVDDAKQAFSEMTQTARDTARDVKSALSGSTQH